MSTSASRTYRSPFGCSSAAFCRAAAPPCQYFACRDPAVGERLVGFLVAFDLAVVDRLDRNWRGAIGNADVEQQLRQAPDLLRPRSGSPPCRRAAWRTRRRRTSAARCSRRRAAASSSSCRARHSPGAAGSAALPRTGPAAVAAPGAAPASSPAASGELDGLSSAAGTAFL